MHPSVRELGLVGFIAGAVALILYEPHAINGGFLSDGWSQLALYEFAPTSGFWDTLSYFLDQANLAPRPLQAAYLLVLYEVLGNHVGFWLTWQIATNVLMVLMLFVLLRRLSIPGFDAGVIATLVLIFPAADSLRFWTPTIQAPMSIMLALLGFVVALAAFDAMQRRSRFLLHTLSLFLFVLSVLFYEVTLPILLTSLLLYRLHVRWREAALRWAADCAVLIPVVLTVTLGSSTGHQETEAGILAHATTIFDAARALFTTVVLPFGSADWYVVGLIALIPVAAVLVYRRLPQDDPMRAELRRWLMVIIAGLAVVGLGYAIFVPGTDYYNPMAPGVGNRINAVPSIGWVLIFYACAILAASLAFRGLPRARLLSSLGAAIACALIATGWIRSINDYSDYFTRAYAEDTRVLAMIHNVIPTPRPNSTIWTFGQPVEIVPGVPVFGNTWDMTGSVQLEFDDPSLTSLVAEQDTTFHCGRHSVIPGGKYALDGAPDPAWSSPYGHTYFINTVTGRSTIISTPRQCHQAAQSFTRSPPLPGG